MDKKYIVDIRNRNNYNDFVLDISDINNLNAIDLDINKNIDKCKRALENEELNEAYDFIKVLKNLTEYSDKRFSDINILFKIKEIILDYKRMDKENIVNSMEVLLKVRSFFRFLSGEISFKYDDKNTILIEEVKDIKNNIKIKISDLVDKKLYRNMNILVEEFDIVLQFKKAFEDDEEYCYIKDVYDFFRETIENKIKIAVSQKSIELYKDILKNKYDESFYKSKEFENLVNKNNINSYEEILVLFDKYYLLYKFNKEISKKEKGYILMKILLSNFNIPKIYRVFVIENIMENRKSYMCIEDLFNDINKSLRNIRENSCLNAIII